MTKRILAVTTHLRWYKGLHAAFDVSAEDIFLDIATNLMEAYSQTEESNPQLVIVDHSFTKLPEFEMMRQLFSALNIRWLRVTDTNGTNGVVDAEKALFGNSGIFNVDISDRLTKTIRHLKAVLPQKQFQTPQLTKGSIKTSNKVLLLGSSTGGIDALATIFSSFSHNCPPTFVVQHTGEKFGAGLVQTLSKNCSAKVIPAQGGTTINPGEICIAAGGRHHLQISKTDPCSVTLVTGQPVSGHLPSIDFFFRSAVVHAKSIIAGLLTGMGQDGAAGLLELRQAGATTFAQDKASSVVYGMPRAAWENGAAQTQVPLENVSSYIGSLSSPKATNDRLT